MTKPAAAFACLILSLLPAAAAGAAGRFAVEGPVEGRVVRVVDGDTLLVLANPWPQHEVRVYVRLRGIDAPEMRSRCEAERKAAKAARRALGGMAAPDTPVRLTRISGDKYFGRVLADVRLADGSNPARDLLAAGHVRPYQGGRKPHPGCP